MRKTCTTRARMKRTRYQASAHLVERVAALGLTQAYLAQKVSLHHTRLCGILDAEPFSLLKRGELP